MAEKANLELKAGDWVMYPASKDIVQFHKLSGKVGVLGPLFKGVCVRSKHFTYLNLRDDWILRDDLKLVNYMKSPLYKALHGDISVVDSD